MQLESDKSLTKSEINLFRYRMKLKAPSLPVPVIVKTVETISDQLSTTPKVPSEFELEITYKKFITAIHANQWDAINSKDWKYAPYVFWYGDEILGGKKEFLTKYFNWLNSQNLKSNWRRLIYSYLRGFNYRKEFPSEFKAISRSIQKAFKISDLKFGLELWEKRHNKVGLFADNFDLSKSINAFIVDANYNWNNFIALTGLDGELSLSGYVDAVGSELLKQLNLSGRKELIEAALYFHFTDQQLRFNDKRVEVIQSLLSPWIRNSNPQNDELQEKVKNTLIKHFKDPRLPIHREKGWRFIDDSSLSVVFRWLIGESLEQFFSIIDEMALEHQWKYRKAFWMAYHNVRALDEAWVAFGPEARRHAWHIYKGNFSAGVLDGGQTNQSVLIVRIKNLVLAEWSHNGKCRAWRVTDKRCPRAYEPKYTDTALQGKSLKIVPAYKQDGISHQQSENYHWQRRLADFIYDETGIRVQDRDFRI